MENNSPENVSLSVMFLARKVILPLAPKNSHLPGRRDRNLWAFWDRKGTPKNLCDKDFAELSGEHFGAICLKTLISGCGAAFLLTVGAFLWRVPNPLVANPLVAERAFPTSDYWSLTGVAGCAEEMRQEPVGIFQ